MSSTDSDRTISRSSILYGSAKEDVWFDLDQFYTEHIREIYQRISTIDDEIWGKIVLMEKNKRIAKAYLRTPLVVVDGSCTKDGFDGRRLGFNSFENPARDRNVEEIRSKIGAGVILKMDQKGNMIAKRVGTTPVIIQGTERSDFFCFGTEVTKLKGRLEINQPVKVFDMRTFKTSVDQEIQKPYPDRKRLMFQTLLRVSLVKDEPHPFKTPCWFVIINLVALDMLINQVPTVPTTLPPEIYSPHPDELSRQHLMRQQNGDLYGTLSAPVSNYAKTFHYPAYPNDWPEMNKCLSMDTFNQYQSMSNVNQRTKSWKPTNMGGYMSEAEGMKMMHKRGRSSEPRMRPVSQCWSMAPSVENLHLYATVDSVPRLAEEPVKVAESPPIQNVPNNGTFYETIKRNGWVCVVPEYEANRIEIYESSNTSSNSASSDSCRPSSPSIVSEASDSQTSDSAFHENRRPTTTISSENSSENESASQSTDRCSLASRLSRQSPNQAAHHRLLIRGDTNVSSPKVVDEVVTVIQTSKETQSKETSEGSSVTFFCGSKVTNVLSASEETKPVAKCDEQVQHPVAPLRKRRQKSLGKPDFSSSEVDDSDEPDGLQIWSF